MSLDRVDAAIAAATGEAPKPEMVQIPMTLGTGRPFVVALPRDFTDMEAVQAVQGLLMAMDAIRAQFPPSRIAVVKGGRVT